MALTWRDVNPTNNAAAMAGVQVAGNSIQQGLAQLGNSAQEYGTRLEKNNTNDALAQLSSATDLDQLNDMTSPEALAQMQGVDKSQIAAQVEALRNNLSQQQNADRTYDLNVDKFNANNKIAQQKIDLAKNKNDVYSKAVNLQYSKYALAEQQRKAFTQGAKGAGDFSTQKSFKTYLSNQTQKMLDEGKSAQEVNAFVQGAKNRFENLKANSPTAGLAASFTAKQSSIIDNYTEDTTNAITTTSSMKNPDNRVVAQIPSLSSKIKSNQDAIDILKTRFGKGSGKDVKKYIANGAAKGYSLPVLVSSALQKAGDNRYTGSDYFDASAALTQAGRVIKGLQTGKLSQLHQIAENDKRVLTTLTNRSKLLVQRIADTIARLGSFKEDSKRYKEGKEELNDLKAKYQSSMDTLRSFHKAKVKSVPKHIKEATNNENPERDNNTYTPAVGRVTARGAYYNVPR